MRRFLPTAFVVLSGCIGCRGDEAPPFDPQVFVTPEVTAAAEVSGLTPGESICDPAIGMVAPLPTCYPERVCERVLPIPGRDLEPIEVPTRIPLCATSPFNDHHGPWRDEGPRHFTDRDFLTRRYCVRNDDAEAGPMPLVLFFHGTSGGANDVYDHTHLPQKADTYDLGGPEPGFVLLSVQGRNLHWPTDDPRDGEHHDVFHRDLSKDSSNRDVGFADWLIDEFVEKGIVDPARIYVMGWSNGAHFAQMYGIARHETSTPGGNRVAAVVGYSAADPFHNRAFDQEPSCQLAEYPRSSVPIMLIGRDCDAIACSDDQFEHHRAKGRPVTPGSSMQTWERELRDRVGVDDFVRVIIDKNGEEVADCVGPVACGVTRALLNHVAWPDGVRDGGGVDWEPRMLDFLRARPLEP